MFKVLFEEIGAFWWRNWKKLVF